MELVLRLAIDEEGADFIEYAFVLGMISIATATLVTPLTPTILAVFQKIIDAVSTVKP